MLWFRAFGAPYGARIGGQPRFRTGPNRGELDYWRERDPDIRPGIAAWSTFPSVLCRLGEFH